MVCKIRDRSEEALCQMYRETLCSPRFSLLEHSEFHGLALVQYTSGENLPRDPSKGLGLLMHTDSKGSQV